MKRTRESYIEELLSLTNVVLANECKRHDLPHSGTKKVKIDRLVKRECLQSSREVAEEIKAKESMNLEEFLGHYAFLDHDQSHWDFPIAMELGRFLGRASVEGIKERDTGRSYCKIHQQLRNFQKDWFRKCLRKDRIQPYDLSFHSFLNNLVVKGAENWTSDDTKEIIEKFGNVYRVDCSASTISGVHTYSLFQKELLKRYSYDPKLKYYLDPYVVVVDLPETHSIAIFAAIAAFVPNPSLAALPNKDNASANPFIWSFEREEEAFWWMNYLKTRIPTINLLYYETVAAALNYHLNCTCACLLGMNIIYVKLFIHST